MEKNQDPKIILYLASSNSYREKLQIRTEYLLSFGGIWSKGPSIVIGDNVFVGSGCEFNNGKNIKIGNESLIASGCRFIDHDHGFDPGKRIGPDGKESPIQLEENVWLGCNCRCFKWSNYWYWSYSSCRSCCYEINTTKKKFGVECRQKRLV